MFYKILSLICVVCCLHAEQEVVILLGPPGSGKGTQSETLKNETSFLHISTGDLIRNFLKNNPQDPLAQQMKSYIDKGALVPDQLIIDLLGKRLEQPDAKKGVILDGFPRTVAQAESLDKLLNGQAKLLVINLDVPDQKLISRLEGRLTCSNCGAIYNTKTTPSKVDNVCDTCQGKLTQRKDDTLETIKNRLEVYKKETQPLINYYQSKGLLKTVNGDQDKAQIENQIREITKKDVPASSN